MEVGLQLVYSYGTYHLGAVAGKLLLAQATHKTKIVSIVTMGITALLAGYALDIGITIIKRLLLLLHLYQVVVPVALLSLFLDRCIES